MADSEIPLNELLKHLETLALGSLRLWALPDDAEVQLINVSENVTYLVESAGTKQILRVHRENYHTLRAIECELAWMDALQTNDVIQVPKVIQGSDGAPIQQARTAGLDGPRYMVMFEFLEGQAPDEAGDLSDKFYDLGAIAARCHLHVEKWDKPENFERLTWDAEAVFGVNPTWGNWRDAPGVTANVAEVLEQVEAKICAQLRGIGKGPDVYGLIHADMRLANLIVGSNGTQVIDFDDCGLGWFMYDFAAAISFIEDDPQIPTLKTAWVEGYRTIRPLGRDDEASIETMIMLRRMALLAWIGSHIEAPEPQALAPKFAAATKALGLVFLNET